MKKFLIALSILLFVASMAFAQDGKLSYVGTDYTGSNTARTTRDLKLGPHDVLASNAGGTFAGAAQAQQRNGCQSCHVPHGSKLGEGGYLWANDLPTNVVANGATLPINARTFHTLACLSCHDGVTAANVVANNPQLAGTGYANVSGDTEGLMNDHPIDQPYGHGAPPAVYVRLYTAAGAAIATGSSTAGGYVECASCHDPHAGDNYTYSFLRGPGATFTVAGGVTSVAYNSYSQTDKSGLGTTVYTGTSPQWARLGLCRDCHGR